MSEGIDLFSQEIESEDDWDKENQKKIEAARQNRINKLYEIYGKYKSKLKNHPGGQEDLQSEEEENKPN